MTYQLNNIVPVLEPIDFDENDAKYKKDKDGKYIHDASSATLAEPPESDRQ